MKNRRIIICSLFIVHCSLLFVSPLFASAKKDTTEPETLDNDWILCVTAFDYSLLPLAHRIAGDVLTRELVTQLSSVNYRFRISPEYAYYESYAWQQALSVAAKALSNKQNERSLMLYRGEANWKYRRDLKKIDAEIVKLQEEFAQKEAEKPLINREPSFDLSQTNKNGTYPAPPKPGEERRFCQNQKVDAFLSGQIREFHGRYYINLRLFTLYTNSWVYDDDIIFSLEDSDGAVEEIAARLSAVLTGTRAATVAVTVDPPESQILINHNYAGRGTVDARERPPGKVTIAIAAEEFMPETVELDLDAGEQVDVAVTLGPLYYSEMHIAAPGHTAVAVYHGSLYVGDAPLTLRLPVGQLNYVTLESDAGERAKAVFTAPDMPDTSYNMSLKLKMPPKGERRVNKARSWYYWAWAGTWITGLTAWVSYGWYTLYNDAMPQDVNGVPYAGTNPEYVATVEQLRLISTGAIIAVGAAVVYEVIQMARYIYTSTESGVPIVKQRKQKK
jgi:hypothetical protein